MGLSSLSSIPGSIGGPPMIGALFDSTGDFLAGAMVSAVLVFLAVGFMFAMPLDGEPFRLEREAKKRRDKEKQEEDVESI